MQDDQGELAELKKLVGTAAKERKRAARTKKWFSIAVGVLFLIFFFSLYGIFKGIDQEEVAEVLKNEMGTLGPVLLTEATNMVKELQPVYVEEFKKAGEDALPRLEKKGRKEAEIFAKYVETEVVPRFTKRMESVLGKYEKQMLKKAPTLEDEEKITQAFENLLKYIPEEANAVAVTGIFSEQTKVIAEIKETLDGFDLRMSDDTASELVTKLFDLLGRIVEYEYFVGRTKEKEEEGSPPGD